MTVEFTGERIIPGQVDADLWNEHFARYAFAVRLVRGKRVLDLGCGTGYGAAELARTAAAVSAVDVAPEAVEWAREKFGEHADFRQASATALPFDDDSFDAVVCFEVIEHLAEWPRLLTESKRVLAPGGVLIVSTPNKSFYAETRKQSGPNPFHEHEFEFEEFQGALGSIWRHVRFVLEDHVDGVAFRSLQQPVAAEVRIAATRRDPAEASFYIALCSDEPLAPVSDFVYIPEAANLLRERTLHIERLEGEIKTKDGWIAQLQAEHAELLRQHEALQAELEKSNRWAQDSAASLKDAWQRIAELQDELAATVSGYQARVSELESDLAQRTGWAQQATADLAQCVEALHATEATLEERTRWAQSLDEQVKRLESLLAGVRASRWVRLGKAAGLGPELPLR